GLPCTADALGDLLSTLAPSVESEPRDCREGSGEKKDDDVADDRIFQRPPVAEGDERAGKIHDGRQRAEPDAEQNRADYLLAKHFSRTRFRVRYSLRSIKISTRRFLARPSGVALLVIGTSGPFPSMSTRPESARPSLSTAATALARSTERSKFEGKRTVRVGVLSVWPTILMCAGSVSRVAAT